MALQMLGELVPPLARPFGVTRRYEPHLPRVVDIFFAFGHKDSLVAVNGYHLGEPIRDATDAF
jgi:hypothetical protein